MPSIKSVKAVKQSSIKVDEERIYYSVLEDETIVVSQNSFFEYLKIESKEQKDILSKVLKELIPYKTINDQEDLGIRIEDFTFYCLVIFKIDSLQSIFKDASTKIYSLIELLMNVGLNSIIDPDSIHDEEAKPSFDDMLAGLMRVPPPKK